MSSKINMPWNIHVNQILLFCIALNEKKNIQLFKISIYQSEFTKLIYKMCTIER